MGRGTRADKKSHAGGADSVNQMTTLPYKNDPCLSLITEELRQKQGCHTAILYGSRARGDETLASDYDILGVRESGEVTRDARVFNGFYLDIFIYPESKLSSPDETMLHMRGGKVLFQKDDLGIDFLKKLEEIYSLGPKKLPPDEIQARKVWARKMLDRAKLEDMEGNFRRAWLVTALLEDHFSIRGEWYRGPKESLKWLQANRPALYARFEVALKPGAPLSDIEKLVTEVHA